MMIRILIFILLISSPVLAQEAVLKDNNGDGVVNYLGFGDSITFGLGDGTSPGQFVETPIPTSGRDGYVRRVSELLQIPAINSGVPGEEIALTGAKRYPAALLGANPDVVGIFEGTNDAVRLLSSGEYRRLVQRMINVTFAIGREPLLFTIPPPCCNHAGPGPFTNAYSRIIRDLSASNGVRVVDIERAWRTTCSDPAECNLYNLPEGLHPNTLGYDVIAQTAVAALLGIDIFAPSGAADLEAALSLPAGSVVVKPDL